LASADLSARWRRHHGGGSRPGLRCDRLRRHCRERFGSAADDDHDERNTSGRTDENRNDDDADADDEHAAQHADDEHDDSGYDRAKHDDAC
jgi:hypothetical protein